MRNMYDSVKIGKINFKISRRISRSLEYAERGYSVLLFVKKDKEIDREL